MTGVKHKILSHPVKSPWVRSKSVVELGSKCTKKTTLDFRVAPMYSDQPQNDLAHEVGYNKNGWMETTNPSIKYMSAVCLLTARYMADVLGKNKVWVFEYHHLICISNWKCFDV